jgi:putative flippase GtrA
MIDSQFSTRTVQSLMLLVRFGIVGLLNTAFGYAVFALLLWIDVWPGAALVAATIAGAAFNFQTLQKLVFRSRAQFARFFCVYGIVLAVNWAGLRILRDHGLSNLMSQALLTLPVAALSFLAQRRLVFGRRDLVDGRAGGALRGKI